MSSIIFRLGEKFRIKLFMVIIYNMYITTVLNECIYQYLGTVQQ